MLAAASCCIQAADSTGVSKAAWVLRTPQQFSNCSSRLVCCPITLLPLCCCAAPCHVVPCHAMPCCVGVQEQQLYPCVGMRTKHEEVRANFGGAPFCVDLNKLHVSVLGCGWTAQSLHPLSLGLGLMHKQACQYPAALEPP